MTRSRETHPGEDPAPSSERALRDTLVGRAREGSQAARGELFETMRPGLERYLRRKVGTRLGRAVSISDITQESFVQSFGVLDRLAPGAGVEDFKGLLFKNAHWLLHKAARRNQHFMGESVVGLPLPSAVPAGTSHASAGEVTRRDENGWLGRQIERLSPEDASVLRLRGTGLGFDEIAAELGIGLEAARKRCLRASRRLRTLIEGG